MAFLQDDEKFLDSSETLGSGQDEGSQFGSDQSAGQSPGGSSAQPGVVNPGSVGGSTSTGGGFTPSWVNVQSYLKANPQESPVVAGMPGTIDKVTADESKRLGDYSQNVGGQFDDLWRGMNRFTNYDDPAAGVANVLNQQVNWDSSGSAKPISDDYMNDLTNSLNTAKDFLGANLTGYEINPYSQGQQYQDISNALSNRDAFSNYVNQQNAQMAGRELTAGERALQNQLDLSSGQYDKARDYALEKLAGLDTQRDVLNDRIMKNAEQIPELQQRQADLKKSLMEYTGPNAEYVKRWMNGTWDPGVARVENEQNWFYENILKPLQQDLSRRVASTGPGYSADTILNSPNNPYSVIKDPYYFVQDARGDVNTDDLLKQIALIQQPLNQWDQYKGKDGAWASPNRVYFGVENALNDYLSGRGRNKGW